MLHNTQAGEVPARQLAQLRLMASTANLDPVMASAFADGAASRGMTMAEAEKAAAGLVFLSINAVAKRVDDAKLIDLTDEYLTKVRGGTEAEPEVVARSVLLAYMAAEDAKAGPAYGQVMVGQSWDSPRGIATRHADAFTAHLSVRMGLKTDAPTMGRDMGEFTLARMAGDMCRAAGLRPYNGPEAIRMAAQHTGGDFSYAIGNGLSGVVARGFAAAEPAIVKCASEVPADDYRQRNSVSLSGSAVPGRVIEGAKINYVSINEKGELAAKPDDFAAIFSISNQALQNDSTAMGLFSDIARKMIIGANAQFRNVLLDPLVANSGLGQTMTDGQPLFHVSHGNVAAAGAALSVTSLGAARTAMRRQKDSMGIILAVEPAILLVAPEQETVAQQLVASLAAAQTSNVNPFSGRLEVVTDAGLTSPLAWYLLADPARAQGLTYAFIDGKRTPRVEVRDGWDVLGQEYRLVWSLGAAFVEYASWYRNVGA